MCENGGFSLSGSQFAMLEATPDCSFVTVDCYKTVAG